MNTGFWLFSGDWGPGDDRRMLKALYRSGATNEWEVDWGNLVSQRSAHHAKRRWRLMLQCVEDRCAAFSLKIFLFQNIY